ncbi:hypothetical protein [Streptomyces sp. GESEQ-35]|uniref:hypothetical protein n=1 Tax=Streptomyces sp. GESEQ-35 TaxID=2812657 RepID=UPI001B31D82C|nr:hypothetical protein [Streptomyces sp. GESEQ-35]
MRRRSLLLVLLLIIVGATTTTTVILSRHSDAAGINGALAADVGNAEHTVTLQNRTDSRI